MEEMNVGPSPIFTIADALIAVAVQPWISGGENKPPRLLNNELNISRAHGQVVGVPENIVGFALHVLAQRGTILCQRDYGKNKYFKLVKSPKETLDPELEWRQPRTMIEVRYHEGWGLYTVWPDKTQPLTLRSNNNIGLWGIEKDGHVTFRRIGVVCPNGRDFYVVYDLAWEGYLRKRDLKVVGAPIDFKYGPFSARRSILEHQPFADALPLTLYDYEGTDKELEVPLTLSEEPNGVILDWWNPFMGMGRGQGIVLLHDGSSAWLRGQDVEGLGPDKPVYLERGQRMKLIPKPNGKVMLNDMGKTPRIVGARLID